MKSRSTVDIADLVGPVGGNVDEAKLTLGIYGRDLDPRELSVTMECEPTSSYRRGDRRINGLEPWPNGAWLLILEGRRPTTPDQLVGALMKKVRHEAGFWDELRSRYTVRISLAIFVVQWTSGFELAPSSVAFLSNTGAKFGLTVYAEVEPEDDASEVS